MEKPVYHLPQVVKSKEAQSDFDGPLDLILHLLSKNRMQISDIQIVLIFDQYLDWMEQRKRMDLEVASEFVTMASQLMFIKSRMLLNIRDEEALSEIEQLKAQLEARQRHESYGRIKAVTPQLAQRYQFGKDYICKSPEVLERSTDYPYVHCPQDLLRGLRSALLRGEGSTQQLPYQSFSAIVGKEPYPVGPKAEEILTLLTEEERVLFSSLFLPGMSRSELVATFLAVLELCKQKKINLIESDTECALMRTAPEPVSA